MRTAVYGLVCFLVLMLAAGPATAPAPPELAAPTNDILVTPVGGYVDVDGVRCYARRYHASNGAIIQQEPILNIGIRGDAWPWSVQLRNYQVSFRLIGPDGAVWPQTWALTWRHPAFASASVFYTYHPAPPNSDGTADWDNWPSVRGWGRYIFAAWMPVFQLTWAGSSPWTTPGEYLVELADQGIPSPGYWDYGCWATTATGEPSLPLGPVPGETIRFRIVENGGPGWQP